MELNWTTFFLEILNFLVLVWLLKRLLYLPVKEMIEKRRLSLEEQLQKTRDMKKEAEQLTAQYTHRLADWEKERQEARTQLEREIAVEREHLLSKLEDELSARKKKNEILDERNKREQQEQCEFRGVEMGARFAANLLARVASEDLESRLIELLMAEIRDLPDEQRNVLATISDESQNHTAEIASAYLLSEQRRHDLQIYVNDLLDKPLAITFIQDPKLLAGVRIKVGPWIIDANLAEELRAFSAAAQKH